MERESYSVEITTYAPVKAIGIATYVHVPGNPKMQRGGGSGWNTCGHEHRTYEAAVKCARAINNRSGHKNENELA